MTIHPFRSASATAMVATTLVLAGCGGGHGDAASGPDLAAAPTHVWWSPYQGVQLPNADQGPTKTDNGLALGFARVPAGAALAAAVHTVRISIAPDDQWPAIVNAEVFADAARDDFVTNRVQLSITGPANPKYAPHLRGYRVLRYGADAADVDVYTSYSDRSLAVNHTTVVWANNDWRLRLPAPNSTGKQVESIGELPKGMVALEAPGV